MPNILDSNATHYSYIQSLKLTCKTPRSNILVNKRLVTRMTNKIKSAGTITRVKGNLHSNATGIIPSALLWWCLLPFQSVAVGKSCCRDDFSLYFTATVQQLQASQTPRASLLFLLTVLTLVHSSSTEPPVVFSYRATSEQSRENCLRSRRGRAEHRAPPRRPCRSFLGRASRRWPRIWSGIRRSCWES